MIPRLERNFLNHFNHSFGTFEHVSDQNLIYEQNDSDLDQCTLYHFIQMKKKAFTNKPASKIQKNINLQIREMLLLKQSTIFLSACDCPPCSLLTAI